MDRWEGKVAIVTGASAGIGATIAEELVKAGLLVVGLARRLEKLEQLSTSWKNAKGKLYARQCDVSKEKDLLEAFEWVNAELGGVDILVNNAGIFKSVHLIDDDIQSFRNILDINVLATAITIRKAVASMKSRDVAGHIININGIFGHQVPNPKEAKASLCSASKFAITALTETVRKELATDVNNKIKITSISPGVVRTEIFEASGLPDTDFVGVPSLNTKDIADGVLYVLGTPHQVQSISPGTVKTEIAEASGFYAEFYNVRFYIDPKYIADAVLYVLGTPHKVQVTELTIMPVGQV